MEDFEASPQGDNDFDPWEPLFIFRATDSSEAEDRPTDSPALEDFWDPISPSHTDVEVVGASNWQTDILLPDFVPHAAENPFRLELRAPSSEDKAGKRARWLVSLLDLPQLERRRVFERRFSELFAVYPHAATFSALADLALEGAVADDLWCAFELKEIWASSPSWWSMRRRGSRQPLTPDGGMGMLGWARSHRFIIDRKGLPPEAIIDPDWFDDWLELSIGDPLYWRFIDYAEARIEAFAAGTLESPVPPRRHIGSRPIVTIDGFDIFNSFSRTAILYRAETESWALTAARSEDVLSPNKVRA
ncbi:hypothetical protein JQ634_15975 [Bradyrhizobium sp. AUGA SZCCT0240]|uniref:hypothetical protein n=1 Tax=Bradyrhizobium sp. AUGA SZCCT0240 TaxID=2807669 RepID=UPI001BAA06BA|nr:hypothetical protein [Bradyrhizobium sp. AUGA SZCCT0240]MBR1255194.1 hypothetical protein [Bradyrhizobium sp. AUGA SZCCT0240]